jgi:sugar phosphate isomerase/epimerase
MKKWKGRIGCLHVKACNWAVGPEALGMICPVPPLEEGITRDHQQANQAYAEWVQGPMERNTVDWTEIFETAEAAGCTTFIHERERVYIPGDIIASVKADFAYIRKCLDAMK